MSIQDNGAVGRCKSIGVVSAASLNRSFESVVLLELPSRSFFTLWMFTAIASLLLYVFSLFEFRRQKSHLAAIRPDDYPPGCCYDDHDDVWPPDHYDARGGAYCCDGAC